MLKNSHLLKLSLSCKSPYLFTILAVLLMMGLRFLLQPILHSVALLILPTVAVTLSAFYGGLGPGLLATLLSLAFTWLLFLQQEITVRPPLADMVAGLIVFATTGLLVSILGKLIQHRKKYSESLLTELQRRNDELQQSELTNRALLEASAQGVVAVDSDGQIKIANEYLHKMFGYEPNELIGLSVAVLIIDG